MPIFEYKCSEGHVVERLRSFTARGESVTCDCGRQAEHIEISQPHCLPDGMYSYAPNVGSEAAFARRLDAMKNGEKVYKKEA